MEYRFNVTKGDRKALVKAISECIGGEPVYKGVPSCAYEVNDYTIDRLGTLTTSESSSGEEVSALLSELQSKGFLYETEYLEEIPTPDEQHGNTDTVDEAETEPDNNEADVPPADTTEDVPTGEFAADTDRADEDESVPDDAPAETSMQDELPEDESSTVSEETDGEMDTPTSDAGHSTAALPDESPTAYFETKIINNKLAISVPLDDDFTQLAYENLQQLTDNKEPLFKRAFGTEDLPILETETAVQFPWFPIDATIDEIQAYQSFISLLCEKAKSQRRVTAKKADIDSEKYAFRCFLLRLEMKGPAYASARKILLAPLPGNSSFKSGDGKKAAPENAQNADTGDETNEGASTLNGEDEASGAATAAEPGQDCLSCGQSMSDGPEDNMRLFCVVKGCHVNDFGYCENYN